VRRFETVPKEVNGSIKGNEGKTNKTPLVSFQREGKAEKFAKGPANKISFQHTGTVHPTKLGEGKGGGGK